MNVVVVMHVRLINSVCVCVCVCAEGLSGCSLFCYQLACHWIRPHCCALCVFVCTSVCVCVCVCVYYNVRLCVLLCASVGVYKRSGSMQSVSSTRGGGLREHVDR